jgi:hypothetical protein
MLAHIVKVSDNLFPRLKPASQKAHSPSLDASRFISEVSSTDQVEPRSALRTWSKRRERFHEANATLEWRPAWADCVEIYARWRITIKTSRAQPLHGHSNRTLRSASRAILCRQLINPRWCHRATPELAAQPQSRAKASLSDDPSVAAPFSVSGKLGAG